MMNDFFRYLKSLPPILREKILKLKKWEDRQCFFGKLLLKKGLEDLGKDFDLQNLKYNGNTVAHILEHYVDFNISHTKNFVACAIFY